MLRFLSLRGSKNKSLLRTRRKLNSEDEAASSVRKKKSRLSSRTMKAADEEAKAISDGLTNLAAKKNINPGGEEGLDEYDLYFSKPRPKPPPEHCRLCSFFHSSDDVCVGDCCLACKSEEHYEMDCPYLEYYPKGEYFDSELFEIRCRCGCPFFNTEKWVCPSKYCGFSKAVLKAKDCIICRALNANHTMYDCPEDTEQATAYKTSMLEYYLPKP